VKCKLCTVVGGITLRGGYNIDGALARFVFAYPILFVCRSGGEGLEVECGVWSVGTP